MSSWKADVILSEAKDLKEPQGKRFFALRAQNDKEMSSYATRRRNDKTMSS